MLVNILTTTALFAASALAIAQPDARPAPYKLGKMSINQAFGLMARQDQGYQPTQTECGPGADCPSACGADTVQCASSDDNLHCYEPSIGQTCCPDGSGNACDQGYYCTDNSEGTWCCPDVRPRLSSHPALTDMNLGNITLRLRSPLLPHRCSHLGASRHRSANIHCRSNEPSVCQRVRQFF